MTAARMREMTASMPAMVPIPGGTFRMGSDRHYPEEGPARSVHVDPFLIDRAPVKNRDFAAFVDATGHVTVAERVPDPADYPGADPALLQAGSIVFAPPSERPDPRRPLSWWRFAIGACWRRPDGVTALDDDKLDHPVTQIAFADAEAYAAWAGKALPSEAEWEMAARGGLDGADFAWGDDFEPDGRRMANTWPGSFPLRGEGGPDRYGTSPVGAFPPNGFGLVDMIGNTWEWTVDFWAMHPARVAKACCMPRNPRATDPSRSFDPGQPGVRIPRRVLKGGSHLCAPNYCRRYRPAARHPQMEDSATTHVGFRCVRRRGSS